MKNKEFTKKVEDKIKELEKRPDVKLRVDYHVERTYRGRVEYFIANLVYYKKIERKFLFWKFNTYKNMGCLQYLVNGTNGGSSIDFNDVDVEKSEWLIEFCETFYKNLLEEDNKKYNKSVERKRLRALRGKEE